MRTGRREAYVCSVLQLCSERFFGLAFARSFSCEHCGVEVSLDAPGTTHRNHCPSCLWSRHLDRNVPGDRKADCAGGMEPIAVTVRGEGRWVLIHRCTNCGRLRLNKTAGDDNVLLLMRLAALPLTMPFVPFAPDPEPESSGNGNGNGNRTKPRKPRARKNATATAALREE
ncbi:RNHCP domain-containing protein [Kribbella pratensis]|uniref:RNHCP domain-containing protein n=1 Tax=Kribbella pratensis TaxID=2512112 RepID=A0ABY2FJU7_9ACTN|nr:RNHCP domain-containing protein [Kribbella pratensis]TDW93395.1 RNHCP domain-containing protein [Kribbella pratensis]